MQIQKLSASVVQRRHIQLLDKCTKEDYPKEGGGALKTYGGFLISRIQKLGGRVFDKILRQSGVDAFSGAQGRILYVLWEHERLTISEIGRLTSLAKTTLTAMLDRMENAGLVKRMPDPNNRRQIYVILTPKAWALRKDYEQVSEQANDIFYEGFTEEEILLFEDTLRRIVSNFEKKEKEL